MKAVHLFNKYSGNLNLLIDNSLIEDKYHVLKDFYICPICLSKYDKIDGENPLTLEDAPQKSIGGSTNTLTCKKCNNEAGFKIDHHLVNRLIDLDNSKFLPNTEVAIKTEINGILYNATLKIDEKGVMKVFHSKKNNNPRTLEKNIPELKKDKIVDFNFLRKKIIPDNLDYAVLKTAYILLFQYTGYKVILTDDYDIIRSQILKPEKRLIPKNFYFFSEKPYYKEGIYFICEKGLEIIMVVFTAETNQSSRNFCVFLPIPNKNYETTLDKIFEIKRKTGEVRLSAFPENIKNVDYINDLERIQRLANWFNEY